MIAPTIAMVDTGEKDRQKNRDMPDRHELRCCDGAPTGEDDL